MALDRSRTLYVQSANACCDACGVIYSGGYISVERVYLNSAGGCIAGYSPSVDYRYGWYAYLFGAFDAVVCAVNIDRFAMVLDWPWRFYF